MNRHPYVLAILLALTTLVGFVGMMVVDGYWDGLFLVIAVLPLVIGTVALLRNWHHVRS